MNLFLASSGVLSAAHPAWTSDEGARTYRDGREVEAFVEHVRHAGGTSSGPTIAVVGQWVAESLIRPACISVPLAPSESSLPANAQAYGGWALARSSEVSRL